MRHPHHLPLADQPDCHGFGVCEHLDMNCRTHATTTPSLHTCQQMGVCQHPSQSCAGDCEMPIHLLGDEFAPGPTPSIFDQIATWCVMCLMYGLSAVAAGGVLGYVWAKFGDDIRRGFWIAAAVLS